MLDRLLGKDKDKSEDKIDNTNDASSNKGKGSPTKGSEFVFMITLDVTGSMGRHLDAVKAMIAGLPASSIPSNFRFVLITHTAFFGFQNLTPRFCKFLLEFVFVPSKAVSFQSLLFALAFNPSETLPIAAPFPPLPRTHPSLHKPHGGG